MKFIVKKEAVLGQNICKEKNMENKKNEFDDIILEKTNKSEKIKKILLRIIALVILFLVVMIVMKLINGKEEQNPIIPSEPTTNTQNSDANGFENMPITEQNDTHEDEFEMLRRQLQGDDLNASVSDENNDINATQAVVPTEPVTELPSQDKQDEANQQTQASKKTTPVKTTKTEPKKEPSPKKDSVKESNKESQDLFKNIQTGDLTPGLYVQIFSVNNLDQKSKELAAVKKKGYDYKLYKTSANGKEITKVLIGPFDKNELASELAKIRKDIAKDAFSFTLK